MDVGQILDLCLAGCNQVEVINNLKQFITQVLSNVFACFNLFLWLCSLKNRVMCMSNYLNWNMNILKQILQNLLSDRPNSICPRQKHTNDHIVALPYASQLWQVESVNMGTKQFIDGSQLCWLWPPRNWSDPVHLPLGYTRTTHWVLLNNSNQKSFKLNTIYLKDTFTSRHENNNQSVNPNLQQF